MFTLQYLPSTKSFEELNHSEVEKFEERLYPNKYSEVGFMGINDKLLEVYHKDKAYLESVNITCQQIADKLNRIILEYKEKGEVISSKHFKITDSIYTKGTQTCPFHELDDKDEEIPSSNDYEITNNKTGEKFWIAELVIHLIRNHGFFEGPGSSYRIDPETIIRILEIKPYVDYSINYVEEFYWNRCESNNFMQHTEDIIMKLKPYSLQIINCESAIIVIFPGRINNSPPCFDINDNIIETWRKYVTIEEKKYANDPHRIKFQVMNGGSSVIDFEANIKERMDKITSLVESYEKGIIKEGLYVHVFITTNENNINIDIPHLLFNINQRRCKFAKYTLCSKNKFIFE